MNTYNISYPCLKTIALFSLMLTLTHPVASSEKVSLSTGLDYSRGSYGETTDTKIWYIPISFKLEKTNYLFKLTVPFIQITGPGIVTGSEANPNNTNNSETTTESGLGDMIGKFSYSLIPYTPQKIALDLTIKIKYPTADESKGLGTGETDYYLQTDGLYNSKSLTTFITFGYKVYGDPPNVDYQNVFYFSVGESIKVSSIFSFGFFYDYRQPATRKSEELNELMIYSSYKVTKKKKLLLYGMNGFSEGSPDWGIGINFSYLL